MDINNYTFLKRAFVRSLLAKDSNIEDFKNSSIKLASSVVPNKPLTTPKKPIIKTNSASKAPPMHFIKDNTGKIVGYAGASDQDVNRYLAINSDPKLQSQWNEWNKYKAHQANAQKDFINKNYDGNKAQASASYLRTLYNNTYTPEGRIEYKKFKSMLDKYGYGDKNVINYALNNMRPYAAPKYRHYEEEVTPIAQATPPPQPAQPVEPTSNAQHIVEPTSNAQPVEPTSNAQHIVEPTSNAQHIVEPTSNAQPVESIVAASPTQEQLDFENYEGSLQEQRDLQDPSLVNSYIPSANSLPKTKSSIGLQKYIQRLNQLNNELGLKYKPNNNSVSSFKSFFGIR